MQALAACLSLACKWLLPCKVAVHTVSSRGIALATLAPLLLLADGDVQHRCIASLSSLLEPSLQMVLSQTTHAAAQDHLQMAATEHCSTHTAQ